MPSFDALRLSPRRAGAVGLAVLLALVVGWLGIRAFLAQRALNEARSAVASARVALLELRLEEADRSLAVAQRQTERARGLTGDVVWKVAGAVPWAGNSFDTAHGLAVAGDRLANDVLPGALHAVRGVDPASIRTRDGRIDTSALARLVPALRSAGTDADALRSDVAALPAGGLIGPVGDARRELTGLLDELSTAAGTGADALSIAPMLLGADRPRRYLVLIQQTGETRGTGGLIGGYVELVADRGRLTAGRIGSNSDLRRNVFVPPPADVPQEWVDRYGDQGSLRIWQNINVSPDLPVVAKVIESRWRAEGGRALDGVITTDSSGLALLLAGNGPITLASGQTLEPEQLVDFFSFGQYIGSSILDQGKRKEQLDGVAGVVVDRLTRGGGDDAALVSGLLRAIRSGHLHLTSDDPALEPVLLRTGFAGGLPQGPAPVAYPVVFNASGGKLDTWLDRRISYEAGACRGQRRRSTITTTLTSTPPPGLPPYVTIRLINGELDSSTTGRVGLMVYGTPGSRLLAAQIDGRPAGRGEVETGTEAGLPVWLVYLDTPPEVSRTVTLQLDEPTAKGAPRVPMQPLARDALREVDVPTCR